MYETQGRQRMCQQFGEPTWASAVLAAYEGVANVPADAVRALVAWNCGLKFNDDPPDTRAVVVQGYERINAKSVVMVQRYRPKALLRKFAAIDGVTWMNFDAALPSGPPDETPIWQRVRARDNPLFSG